ncbi:30S ribosomal protein S6 [Blochmannia endosymbiont of Camponotus sp. C-003]|uniref:30S ribosomal protein S6 n=1 Tax=unclassified Candidatus Blochmanniella TaxID=711328 RepID=UPI002024A9FB|nr:MULTISPECIES: 30S ribosomal protein S6 [unclassified Candidatus Blochmannia]URJ23149.1 30S ribosomal protein S6 [Blochmannia endosymbiont of Camponotus sp. C-003]URJ28618.1 30S ribosomal protein S6 [Blochmannia endosymbiont of Camponotus sp. C-046]
MRYYEIVFMIHPDFKEEISNIIGHYTTIITNGQGKIHRIENWGRRQLAYPVKKLHKAYYVLLNIEVSQDIVKELNDDCHFNKKIIRSMIIRTKYAVVEPSPMMKKREENQEYYINST